MAHVVRTARAVTATKTISKRQALAYFKVAKSIERELFPAAKAYRLKHGTWPANYAAARNTTARAFEVYEEARIFSSITITPERLAVITADATALNEES